MSASVLTHTAERVPRWSSTGHARARLDGRAAWLSTPLSSPKATVIGAQVKSVGCTRTRNHPTAPLPRHAPTLIAALKSP